MALDERRRAVALDQTWDALVRGESAPAPETDDRALVALVTRLQATSAIPTLFSEPERSWRELRATELGLEPVVMPTAATDLIGADVNGWHPPLHERQPAPMPRRSPGRWLASQLATAALALLVLAAGFLLLWQGAVREREAETWLPDAIVSSLPGYAEDVVFEATFATDELPRRPAAAVFYRITLPPGATLPSLAATRCVRSSCSNDEVTKGVGVELVEAGILGVRLDEPLWVQRAGEQGTSVEVQAGQNVELHRGEVAVIHDYTATGEIRNAGSAPVEILGMAVVNYGGAGETIHALPPELRSELLDVSLTTDWEALPDGPVKVVLRRVTLPPESLLPPFEPRGLESIRVERGSIAWTFAQTADAAEGTLRIHRRAGETAPFAITRNGAFRFLESTGAEPAELLVLTIEPAGLDGNPLMP